MSTLYSIFLASGMDGTNFTRQLWMLRSDYSVSDGAWLWLNRAYCIVHCNYCPHCGNKYTHTKVTFFFMLSHPTVLLTLLLSAAIYQKYEYEYLHTIFNSFLYWRVHYIISKFPWQMCIDMYITIVPAANLQTVKVPKAEVVVKVANHL